MRCGGCGLARTSPCPSGAALAAYYPDDYGPHLDTDVSGGDTASPRVPLMAWLKRHVVTRRIWWTPDLPEGARVLELGSGAGHFVRHALARGWDVHAVEPAAEPAKRLARDPRVQVHWTTAEAFDFPPESLDAIFAWMVVEHLENPVAVLTKVRSVLRPGGYFVFSVPNAGSWEFRWFRSRWYGLDVPRHLWHFSLPALRRLLGRCGLPVERVFHQKVVKNISGSLQYLGEDRPRLDPMARRLALAISSPRASFALGAVLALLRQGGRVTVVSRARGAVAPR